MKDFHDLYNLLSASESIPFSNLSEIVHSVLKHRQTPFALPLKFRGNEVLLLQKMWSQYLNGLRSRDSQALPQNVAQVLKNINAWLRVKIEF